MSLKNKSHSSVRAILPTCSAWLIKPQWDPLLQITFIHLHTTQKSSLLCSIFIRNPCPTSSWLTAEPLLNPQPVPLCVSSFSKALGISPISLLFSLTPTPTICVKFLSPTCHPESRKHTCFHAAPEDKFTDPITPKGKRTIN